MQQLRGLPFGRLILLVCTAVLAASLPARAIDLTLRGEPARLDITESLYLIAHLNPGNGDPSSANYGEGISRLNLQLTWGQWLGGIRVDSSDYVHTPQLGDTLNKPNCDNSSGMRCTGTVTPSQLKNRFEQNPIDPEKGFEKLFLTRNGKYVDFTLGDSYVTFGRGLVLSLRKLDELGFDTTLTGGKVVVHAGNFGITAVAGITNTQNLEEQTSRYWLDPNDPIFGLRTEYRFADKVLVGLQGAGGRPAVLADSSRASLNDRYVRYGVTIDAARPLPWLSLYGEYAHAQDIISGANSDGNAYYGAATMFTGRTTVVAEFKSYTNFQPWTTNTSRSQEGSIVYNAPPTLERVITQLTNNSDITAGRVRADVKLNSSVSLYLSPEYGQLNPELNMTDSLIDLYGGAEIRWDGGRSHAFPLLGWRMERTLEPGGKSELYERLVAAEGSLVQALKGPYSAELSWLVWFRQKPLESPLPWVEGQIYIALKSAPRYVITAGYEFTTAQLEQLNQHNFFNAQVEWKITSGTAIRLFGGGERSGLKCVSGICRFFPAFQGVRMEFVARG